LLFVAVFIVLGLIAGALGLTLGTLVKPYQIGILYCALLIPIQFLGCVYYPWSALQHIPWVQIVTLIDPLTYLTEGSRAALTPQVPHMSIIHPRRGDRPRSDAHHNREHPAPQARADMTVARHRPGGVRTRRRDALPKRG
jgi:hypothetical protein